MQAFAITFARSRSYAIAAVAAYAGIFMIILAYFDGRRMAAALAAQALILLWHRRHAMKPRIEKLMVDPPGLAVIDCGSPPIRRSARLSPHSRISRHAMMLHWHTEAGDFHQLVLPDMLSPEDWRRLSVWASWVALRAQTAADAPPPNPPAP